MSEVHSRSRMKRNLFDLETNTHTSTHAHTHRHTHTQTHTYIHPVLPFNTKLPFPLSSLSSLLRSCACGSLGYSGSLPLPASPSLSLAHTLFPPPSLVCSLPHTLSIKLTRSEERRVGKEGRSRWSPYH